MASRDTLRTALSNAAKVGDVGRMAKIQHRLNRLDEVSPEEQAISFFMGTSPLTRSEIAGEGGDIPLKDVSLPMLGMFGAIKRGSRLPEAIKRESGTGFDRQIDKHLAKRYRNEDVLKIPEDELPAIFRRQSGIGD